MAKRGERGQVALYLMLSLVAVFLLTLLAVDVFLSVRTKNHVQNGGDAAALAAAHRQGELINAIGRLNLEHIKAALEHQTNKCIAIGLEQRRLALLQPVYALALASDAAEKNGIPVHDGFSELLLRHVHDIHTLYAGGGGEGDPFPESYRGAWNDYATAISTVAAGGLAAGADNIEFYYAYGDHLLLNPNFYSAIAAEDWCWFWFHAKQALYDYTSHSDWAPLPIVSDNSTENSEIFSLHLHASTNALTTRFSITEIFRIANQYGDMRLNLEDYTNDDGEIDSGLLSVPGFTWFFFDDKYWGRWFDGKRLAGFDADDVPDEFPLLGEIKDEYNVRGCAAVCRTLDDTQSLTTDRTSVLSWTAAAKPFGTLDETGEAADPVTALGSFVVPCMTATRLVAVDTVAQSNLGTADPDWMIHMRIHLPMYMLAGPKDNGGCWYCAQLKKWERAEFHHRGTRWLKYHSGQCVRSVDGGVSGRGGTSRGH